MKKPSKIILITLVTLILLVLLTTAIAFAYLSNKLNYQPKDLSSLLISSYQNSNTDTNLSFLLLGYDFRQDAFEDTLNTDTIILGNYQSQTNQLQLLPLPRDLWDYQNSFKINQIYQKALANNTPIAQTKADFERILATPINKVIVLSTQNIIDIVNLLGGLDLFLETGFIDNQYPNQAYIDNPKSGAPIYTTIEFPAGWNHLDESNITQFIRSRKSSQDSSTGGTDLGRIQRQQLLLDTLISKLKSDYLLKNPQTALKLYHYWQNSIQTDINNQDLLQILFNKKKDLLNLQIKKHNLIIGETPKDTHIYHPTTFINKQWVYIPSTPDYKKLQNFVQDILANKL